MQLKTCEDQTKIEKFKNKYYSFVQIKEIFEKDKKYASDNIVKDKKNLEARKKYIDESMKDVMEGLNKYAINGEKVGDILKKWILDHPNAIEEEYNGFKNSLKTHKDLRKLTQ